jgi:hypothetical protein
LLLCGGFVGQALPQAPQAALGGCQACFGGVGAAFQRVYRLPRAALRFGYLVRGARMRESKLRTFIESRLYKGKYGGRYMPDGVFKIELSLLLSLSVNLLYAAVKLAAGIWYASFWYGADALCYIVFCVIRFVLLRNVRQYDRNLEREYRKYRVCGVMLFALNTALTCAGEKESWGKDAEAAMALSLGKPVIFLCDTETKEKFYKNVHPLTRLINFETGVANGAMIAKNHSDVSTLINRIFENSMQYTLNQKKPGYYILQEKLTGSTVRFQSSDKYLSNVFWNYYRQN